MKFSLARMLLGALVLTSTLGGCAGDDAVATDDLTSITARERTLTFDGYVLVHPDSSDDDILEAVYAQTRSAFGALSTQHIGVGTRELRAADPATFVKEPVSVIEDGAVAYESLRVRYKYVDRAVVPKTMAHKSSLSLGLLNGDYPSQAMRVIQECSLNTKEELEMKDDVWYVFNPSLDSCRDAMRVERDAIEAQRSQLDDPATQVVAAELDRLYIPMTASLQSTGPQKTTYPEYDRLWSGGVQDGKLVITLLNGLIDHAEPGQTIHPSEDSGYWETLAEMEAILEAHPEFSIVATDPPSDMSRFTVDGNTITGVTFQSFVDWEFYDWGFPSWMKAAQKAKLRKLVAERLAHRWVTLEKKFDVAIDGGASKTVAVQLQLYFGVDDDLPVYKRGIKTSDVFLYNGHSYIGEGPLDPENFTDADFPESYQLLFIDSCLSFNYYNQDYFAYKHRGSLDLDIITNGLESWSDGAGVGQGRFIVALLDGKQRSYAELLKSASTTGSSYAWGKDALRVVDGELDNVYKPSSLPIRVRTPN